MKDILLLELWTEIYAVNAEIEGMKALNKECESRGCRLEFNGESFFQKADHLRKFSKMTSDKLKNLPVK